MSGPQGAPHGDPVLVKAADHPHLHEGDIIINRRLNIRCAVEKATPKTFKGHIVGQDLVVLQLPDDHVIYQMSVGQHLSTYLGRSYDLRVESRV
jgi:hypothetical protein